MKPIIDDPSVNKKLLSEQFEKFSSSKKSVRVLQSFFVIFALMLIMNSTGLISVSSIFEVSLLWIYPIVLLGILFQLRNALFEYKFQKAMLFLLQES